MTRTLSHRLTARIAWGQLVTLLSRRLARYMSPPAVSTRGRAARRPAIFLGNHALRLAATFGDGRGANSGGRKGSCLRAVRVAVAGGFGDQRFEEGHVFSRFGMPEDAQGEAARRVLQSFDGAVSGAR